MFDEENDINENLKEKIRLLPAWFCQRMVMKEGRYALVLEGGITVGMTRIITIHQDNASQIWLDINMMPLSEAEVYLGNGGSQSRPIIGATGESKKATLNAHSVMMAYEIGRLYDAGEN